MSFHHVQEIDDPASDGDSNHTMWLRSEGEKTESELSQAVNRSQARQVAIRFVRSLLIIIIIPIVCGLVLAFFASNGDPFTTAVKALKVKYKIQPVVEFTPIHYAINMAFLNITLRSQSENSVIKDIDSWKFFNEVNLKYQTEYMRPTKYSDNSKHKSLRIMFSGHPGAGKTTLMRHIAKEWAQGRALQSCKMLILIHLDRLSTTEQKPESLSQLLQISPLHDQLNDVEEVVKEIQENDGAGVCFLFDSIDRWPHKKDSVHRLFFKSDLRLSLCISTSREVHTFRKQSNIMYFNVLGFNERDLNDNLHALTSDQQVILSIEQLWNSDSDIKDMCKLPLHMVMLIHITNVNTELTPSIHTKIQLYSAFMNVMIKHYSKDLSTWSLERCILLKEGSRHMKLELRESASEPELCIAFQHLHSVAYDMLIHKKDKFPEKDTINININKFGFVNVTKVKAIQEEVMYTFYHQTFVEFFAAIHLLSVPQEERMRLLYILTDRQSESLVENNFWSFFFGLISQYYNEDSNISSIVRQFALYHSEQETEQFSLYFQNKRFLEEWKGKSFFETSLVKNSISRAKIFTGKLFTTAVKNLRETYKLQPVIEFSLLDYATDMPFLNITLRNRSKTLMTNNIDTWKFLSEVNLKHETEYYMQHSDSNKGLRIMISGHPGAGKTTLMRHIAKEWAEERVLPACEILILIHLDRLSTTELKPQSLSQLLQISPYKDKLNNVEEISKEIQNKFGAGVCFLFDSIDRWPHKYDFVHNLFFDFNLRLSLCISTSRQIHTFRKQSNIIYVDLLGFNKRDLNDHLYALTSDQQVISSIQKLWVFDSDIKDLCKLPLLMVMLIHIITNVEKDVSIHTKTQLYSAFMNVTIKHYSEDLSGWPTGSLKKCIEGSRPASESKLCPAFQHLHNVAFDMLIHKKDKFPEKEDLEINKNINKFGFVNVTKFGSTQEKVSYTFYHQSFVEFFAAIHLLSVPQEERLYLYIKDEKSKGQVAYNLWLFFFGLIGEHYNEDDYPNIINIIRQFAMYHSEQEIEQFPPYCQKGRFLEYMKEIQWKGSNLLSSAGIVVNSTLFTPCGDELFMSFDTLLYTLEHETNIHDLRFDNIGNSMPDIDTLLMVQANMWVTCYDLLDGLQSAGHNIQLNIISKNFSDLLYETIMNSLSTKKSAASILVDNILTHLRSFDHNDTSVQRNLKKLVDQISYVLRINNTFINYKLQIENFTDSEGNKLGIPMFEHIIIFSYLLLITKLQETFPLTDHNIIHVPGRVSTYIHVHMTLWDQANLHEKNIKWINAYSIIDSMFTGNILIKSKLLWDSMDALRETIFNLIIKGIPVFDTEHSLEMIQPMLYQTVDSIFHTTNEFWNSLKTLSSHLDTLHLNSIELSCDDFQELVDRLKQKKDNVHYVFDLNIDLGMTQDVLSDSCRKLMSSLNVLIGHNIELKKLTVIIPIQYFVTPPDEFIPHQLQLTGLKHLSIHLPRLLRDSTGYKFIVEVSKFEKLVTLEIQGCPLSHPKLKNKTHLPQTLQELTLGRSSLTDEDVPAVVKLINSKHNLTSLSLPNNLITGSGLKLLIKVLKSHRDFSLLDLSGNPITVRNINGLETLSELSNLRELRLSNCNLGDKEVEVLVDALESNLNLHSLNLLGNPFIGSKHGLEPLARLTNLRHLDISGWQHRYGHCHIEFDEGCIENHTLINVLKNLTQLRFLNLCSESDPPIYWNREMATIISQLPHLQVFSAPCLSFVDYDE